MNSMYSRPGTPVTIVIAALFCSAILLTAGVAYAEDESAPVQFNPKSSLENNLRLLAGKRVSVTLSSGAEYNGKVKSVGNGLLVLEKLSGKSFYDALIRTEDICAVETQVRGF